MASKDQRLVCFFGEESALSAARKLLLAVFRQLWISSLSRSLASSICFKDAWMDSTFNMLSVITSRSSLVKCIKVRAAVRLHMAKISILGQLLFFIGHVDQNIETVALGVTFDNRQELTFV